MKRCLCLWLVGGWMLFRGTLGWAAEGEFLIGAAKVDITPDYPVRLTGYASRQAPASPGGPRIWAKALAIGNDVEGPAVVVTVDNCGVGRNIVDEVAARLERRARVRRERLVVSSSHTHSAPQTIGFAEFIFVRDLPPAEDEAIARYTRELTDQLERVALAALADRRPGRLSWSTGRVDFAANRRTKNGPVDHALPVLVAHDLTGGLRAVVANYACHCTTLGGEFNQTCGDWAGFAGEAIEQSHAGAVALITIGCGADANPSPRGGADAGLAFAQQHGRALAAQTAVLLANPLTPLRTLPECRTQQVALPFAPHFSRAQWEQRAAQTGIVGYHAKKYLARLDRGEALPATLPYLIQTWSFGDQLAMVFLGGEVVVDYVLRLKKELDPQRLWVTAYANDVPCYIPSRRILAEGGYEAEDSLWYYGRPQRLAPETEDRIVATVHALLPRAFALDEKRAEFPPPRSPEEGRLSLRTAPDLQVDLVAAEPHVIDPVAIDWDARGRLWVAEMRDYPMGLDGRWKPGGRIRVLEDLNGDGVYREGDRATVFLDELPFPTGLMAWGAGVFVCAAPDILYAEDTDRDGRADRVEKRFSGFHTDNYQARVNSLEWGLDGWIHGANGLLGGVIRGNSLGREINIRGQDFRFHPQTGAFEPLSGLTQQGRVRDDFGEAFGCDNSTLLRHYPLSDHSVRRNPHVPGPTPSVYVPAEADSNRLYPLSRTLTRFNDLHTAERTTSACGLGLYRDVHLGEEYLGNAFICEPVHNLVHRQVLRPNGVTFRGYRAPTEATSEFLASSDNWFRPVQVRTGPDGGLWVVDMYRFLVEHPRWIAADRLAQIDARAGDDKGRIYRLSKTGRPLRPVRDLTQADASSLATGLLSANGVERDRVHMEVVRRQDRTVASALRTAWDTVSITQRHTRAAVRVQRLSVLAGLGELTTNEIAAALRDPLPEVRRWGCQLTEPGYGLSSARDITAFPEASALLTDPDLRVRLQFALACGYSTQRMASDALARLLTTDRSDVWMRAAILSSATPHSASLLAAAFALPDSVERADWVQRLIATGAANSEQWDSLLRALLGRAEAADGAPWFWDGLTALLRGIERAKTGGVEDYRAEVHQFGVRHPGLLGAWTEARRRVVQPAQPEAIPSALISFLGQHPRTGAAEVQAMVSLLERAGNDGLRSVLLSALQRIDSPDTGTALLRGWSGHSPASRSAIVAVLLSRDEWSRALLAAVLQGQVGTHEIGLTDRQRLLASVAESERERVSQRLGLTVPGDRAQAMERYMAAVPARGEASRGAEVFAQACASCHVWRGQGHDLGPNLAALRDRDTAFWMKNILDPNAAVEPRFVAYQVDTRDGRTLTGLVRAETSTGLTVAQANGVVEQVLRADVAAIRAAERSLMPEGLEQVMTPGQMADLLACLRETPGGFGQATAEAAAAARTRFLAGGNNGLMYLFASAEKLPYPSWLGSWPLALCRQKGGQHSLKWQTTPVPMVLASDAVHVFRIPAAMGYWSQPAGGFTLKLNGKAALSFDVVLDHGRWASEDGRVRMTYEVMENNAEDSNGLLEIAVAVALLQPGQSATFEVVGGDRKSQRWFGLYDL